MIAEIQLIKTDTTSRGIGNSEKKISTKTTLVPPGGFFSIKEIDVQESTSYIQKEGFRIQILSSGEVTFFPERFIEPVSGKIFPVRNHLNLSKQSLKVGEGFSIHQSGLDGGSLYEINLLNIVG